MRTDYTAAFLAKMQAATASPRLLAVFHFASGDVRISDQALGTADGLANEYEPLVEDWGDLRDAGDPRDPLSSEIRQMSIVVWNGGASPFSNRFLGEDPEHVLVDVYQWFLGLTDADKALIDTFVCQDPIASTEASRLLAIDLVSLPMRYDGTVGDILTLANWPNAKEQDIGRYIPLVFGSPGEIPTLVARTAPKCTLNGSILANTLQVVAFEDLDELGLPQSGYLQIGAEIMRYTARTDHSFTISQRGAQSTVAAEHLTFDEIQRHITNFTYVPCKGPIASVDAVKVAGLPAPAAIYTAYPARNPVQIIFSQKPYSEKFSQGSTFLEMQFDSVNEAVNTALQPHLAMDAAAVTSAATINKTNTLLALQQLTANPDRGQIVKAYVAVEWWASNAALQHDRVRISIANVKTLGYLARPNEEDTIDLDLEVDIDHGHSHSISGEHAHLFTDPAFNTRETPHTHPTNSSETRRIWGDQQVQLRCDGKDIKEVNINNCPDDILGAVLHFKCAFGTGFLLGGEWKTGGVGESNIAIDADPDEEERTITVLFAYVGMGETRPNLIQTIYDVYIDFTVGTSITKAYTGVSVAKTASGSNANASDKQTTDVADLSAGNRSVDVLASSMPSRTVVQLFDITDLVNFSWDWFTGKEVRALYQGTTDDTAVYILHCFFDIEYRRSEKIFSDDVTVEVTGLIDDADGTYTGTADFPIRRPDYVRKYLLQARGGLPAENIDEASFAAAGARYAAKNYGFHGLLPGDMTVRQAETKLARECRSRWFWDGGKAHMRFMESLADWTYDKTLVQATAPMRLKGMSYERKRVIDIINRVNLYYYRDWVSAKSGEEVYLSVSPAQNNESISLHGIMENKERFMFDMVRSASMAADLAAFYLEQGAPSQFYTIDGYLPLGELQKEDHLRLTHVFMNLNKAAMRVAGIERTFGSGKLKRMNTVRLICESWYKLLQLARSESVAPTDRLFVDVLWGPEALDTVRAIDAAPLWSWRIPDAVTPAETLEMAWTWGETFAEAATLSEGLVADMLVALADSVFTERADIAFSLGAGFGLGAFGDVLFGDGDTWDGTPSEFLNVLDELAAAEAAVLADEAAALSDELIVSTGFGSPWSGDSGFGLEHFGNVLAVIKNFSLSERVGATDTLRFSSGFGSPWSGDSGFGEEPFGS